MQRKNTRRKKSINTASTIRTQKTRKKKSSAPAGKRRTAVKKNRRTKNRRSQKKLSLGLFLSTVIIIILSVIIIYTFLIFPGILNEKIKNELITIYQPLIYNDADNLFILKLDERPTYDIQKRAYDTVKEQYGLDIEFEKVNKTNKKGINRLRFFRNKKEFNDICPVYIYWDKEIKLTQNFTSMTKQQKKKTKKFRPTHEKIELKRKNEKKEVLIKPEEKSFKKVTYTRSKKDTIKPKIAIVIDDVGYSYNSTFDFLSLGFPVTFAIIPDVPKAKKFYKLFHKYGYELILHIPMEPNKGKKYVENNALLTDMNELNIESRVKYFLNEYPAVAGANNHMGSKAVTDSRVMNILLKELSKRNKYWLDSMTNINTISREIAEVNRLKYYERDVFLDNVKNKKEIIKSMEQLIKEAKQKGKAVGIGHVQTEELVPILKDYYKRQEELGIEFVPLSKL